VIALDQLIELDVERPAHGGACVGHHEGEVVFVRHALPGERVRVRVLEVSKRFVRGDAVEIVRASPHRVVPACPVARPGGCGGCDWQHADQPEQLAIKAAVVQEQLRRLAGINRDVVVEAAPNGKLGGFGWRTRVRFAIDKQGRAGFRAHRSHQLIAVDHCPIAHPLVEAAGVESYRWEGADEIEVAASIGSGAHVVRKIRSGDRGNPNRGVDAGKALIEESGGRPFKVSEGGFWQVHPAAAELLTSAVMSGLAPAPGDIALDLYAGVGLFAASLATAVGLEGQVIAVEGGRQAALDAADNLADLRQVRVLSGDVAAVLGRPRQAGIVGADLVVLDPPRAGAGAGVVRGVAALRPRAVAYVACDPASLARDLATFAAQGYLLGELRAFDLFPQTQHVECVAILTPAELEIS
jgi:tRNA/tmRNA/rRNA uracil-C5-methylase (TrmA/RlmC/RlmD family)